jgi:hypothetical protein
MYWRSPLVVTGVMLLVALSIPAATWAEGMSTATPPGALLPGETTQSKVATVPPPKLTPSPAPKSIAPPGVQPYSMDFTLPTLGKSGCEVCHGDRNLIRIKGDQYVSYYVSSSVIEASAHGPGAKTGRAGVLCTGCHVDFASTTPHVNGTNAEWQRTAKNACRSCHTLEDDAFGKGVHAIDNRPGVADPKADQKPLCGDCHGGHDIRPLDAEGAAALHQSGWQVCGRCHVSEWNSYADYYHGAAYHRGAPDAPSCWDCHGSHQVLPSSDPQSPTNIANLQDTCSGKTAARTCHTGVNADFVGYSRLIHSGAKAYQANPLYELIRNSQTGISQLLSNIADTVRSWFG